MKGTDSITERTILVRIKGTSPKIPSLPRQSGALNAFTFDLVHKMILEQGEKDTTGCIFCDGTRKFFAPVELNCEGPGFVVKDMESRIFRCYIHSDFENDPEASENFKDTISIALEANTFLFMTGQIPAQFHNQMLEEIEAQNRYSSTEEKHEMIRAVGEKIQEFRQAEEEGGTS